MLVFKRRSANEGFTLIELIVVLVILAVLAAILTPMLTNLINEARLTRADLEVQNIGRGIRNFNQSTGKWPIVNGANFNSATTAFFGLPACMTPEDFDGETGTLLNSNQMVFEFTVICSGSWTMTMENAQPGGGSSQTLGFTVGSTPQTNAVPNIASLSPSSITAGNATFNMTMTGSNFTSASTVLLGTAVLTPTSVTSTQIVISVPSILVGSSGVLPIAVTDPNGGTSNRLFFTVN